MSCSCEAVLPFSDVLGVKFASLTLDGACRYLVSRLSSESRGADTPFLTVTANPETVMIARRHPELQRVLREAGLVVADGTGIVWGSRRLGQPLPERVPGIELAERLLAECASAGWRVFLLGGKPGVAEAAGRRLRQRWPGLQVAGTWHGYFDVYEEENVLRCIREVSPALLLAGMGCPRQELWLSRRAASLGDSGVRVAIGVGGALNVWAGHARRAPAWCRRLGMEWAWRLLAEPSRAGRELRLLQFVWEVWHWQGKD